MIKPHQVMVLLVLFIMVVGCTSGRVTLVDGLRITTAGDTNLLRPSQSLMKVEACQGYDFTPETDTEPQVCHGNYEPIDTLHSAQPGALTGVFSTIVQGGAMVGAAYVLGDGIRDSASTTNVNQSGGGATSKSGSQSVSSATQSQQQQQKQLQRQHQGQRQMQTQPAPMMPRGHLD